MKKIVFIFLVVEAIFGLPAFADHLTLTTYYPAPFGAYARIRLVPQAELPPEKCTTGFYGYMYTNSAKNNRLELCQEDGAGGAIWGPLPGAWKQVGNDVYLSDNDTNPNLKVGRLPGRN